MKTEKELREYEKNFNKFDRAYELLNKVFWTLSNKYEKSKTATGRKIYGRLIKLTN